MSVSVVSCLYGDRGYERFIGEWDHAIRQLSPRPDRVIVVSDRHHEIPCAHVYVVPHCRWQHPQAFYLQQAVELAATEWVWVVDIDDRAMPDALDGIGEVDADVWALGYLRSDGELYLPPPMDATDVLAADTALIPAGSAFRVEAFERVGGFPDVALQDWALWRRLAASGATFRASDRPHFHYNRHSQTRGEVELTVARRPEHLAEMLESEHVLVH